MGAAISVLSAFLAWKVVGDRAVADDAAQTRSLIAAGRFQEAESPLRRWLSARPDSGEAVFQQAVLLFTGKGYARAFETLERARTLGFDARKIDRRKGIELVRVGRSEQGEALLRPLLDSPGKSDREVFESIVRGNFERYRLQAAASVVDRWIRELPTDASAHLWRARIGLRTRAEVPVLERDYRETLRLDPTSDEAKSGLATLVMQDKRYAEAKVLLEELCSRKPDDYEAALCLGKALAGLEDEPGALRELERAAALAPRDARALTELARFDLRMGRAEAALSRLDRGVKADPADAEARYTRGTALAKLGRAEEAKADRDSAARLRVDHDVMNKLVEALYIRPDDRRLQYDSARWLFEHGHPEEGMRWARKILQAEPNHRETNQLLADYYTKAGNHALANLHRTLIGGGP